MAARKDTPARNATNRARTIASVTDAPRRLYGEVYSEQLVCWWNPAGFTIPSCTLAVVLDCDFTCCMQALTGQVAQTSNATRPQAEIHGN